MNSCLIVYYSLNHSTAKLAEKIAAGLRQAGLATPLITNYGKSAGHW
ncbi:MAG: hypothetical protein ABGU93_02355 [Acetobacterium sp.]